MTATSSTAKKLDRDGVFVNNEWIESRGENRIDVLDPSYGEVVGSVQEATTEDVDAAVAAARERFLSWSGTSPDERADVLDAIADGIDRRTDEFTELAITEGGVPAQVAPYHPIMSAGMLRYNAGLARTYSFREDRVRPDGGVSRVLQEPTGVVAAIAPWNGPLPVAALKLGPALAAGCTAIMKPAPNTPLATYLLADVIAEVGAPAGVVNVLNADREVSEYLATHTGVDKVSFTGSTVVGKRLMELAAGRLARVTLELGGKSAAIIMDDIPLEAVLPSLVPGGCQNAGQACYALTRVLVSEDRHDELVAAMSAAYAGIKVGDAHSPETEMGPLVSARQRERVENYVALAREEGATVAVGGGRPSGLDRGFFLEPTLLTDVDNSMRIAQEEIFGPVISVLRYRDLDDAVRIANESEYGLSGAVYTADEEKGVEIARRVRTGTISVNTFVFDTTVPFGGYKCSGQGREGGPEGLAPFLEFKSVHLPAPVAA